ncbi:MAG: Lrp/AsnC family transcriptional regulator [Thermoplasmata archaeon]|nr:Lrp/AsnC family transcriptional regulator [Thermoplasmata archaeon]MBE3137218.1 Lrp/AsnC family transcriptional regulator [Thermoplasmata archaeon]MBE3142129.1 Lrp/AsnC family transcriptional regulator [Thermoplasmata archaeon]
MSKSGNETLFKDEKKVLMVLQKNARGNIEDIAKKCKLSPQKVSQIIKKLEAEKTIWGYSAISDERNYNLKHYVMFIKRTSIPFDKSAVEFMVTGRLEQLVPNIEFKIENAEYVHGLYDGIVSFWTDNIVSAKKFVSEFNKKYQECVSNVVLLETLIPLRRNGIKNPNMKKDASFL